METFHFGNLLETFWNFPSPILEAWKFPLDRESFQILHWYIVLLLIIRYINILLYSCSWLVTRDLYRRTVYDNIALYSMETFSKNGNFPMESFGNFLKLSRPNSEVGSFRSLLETWDLVPRHWCQVGERVSTSVYRRRRAGVPYFCVTVI
jgi:hypothetical protein